MSARALEAGFTNEPSGTHTGKTMMLPELRLLLAAVPDTADLTAYQRAVLDDNALAKASTANRKRTFGFLRQLYAFQADVPLFRALRELWAADPAAQPLIAVLCASARDPLLRATADLVLALDEGDPVDAHMLADEVRDAFPDRYSRGVLHHTGQNTAATWVQAGHLVGRIKKHRARARPTYPAAAYALYLGHLDGVVGPALFHTLWARLLDVPASTIESLAQTAARHGWIDFKSAGGMTEIGFSHLDDRSSAPLPDEWTA